jgi:hypothetical protein
MGWQLLVASPLSSLYLPHFSCQPIKQFINITFKLPAHETFATHILVGWQLK